MTISCWSSKASCRFSSFGWWSWFISPISFFTVCLSVGYGVFINFATNVFPVAFSTARWTTPNAPLSRRQANGRTQTDSRFCLSVNHSINLSHRRCPQVQGPSQNKLLEGVWILGFPLILGVFLCTSKLLKQELIHFDGFEPGNSPKYAHVLVNGQLNGRVSS